MQDTLNKITEQALRDLVGQARVNTAYANLSAGHPVKRLFTPTGTLYGVWDETEESPLMQVETDRDGTNMFCTCREFNTSTTPICRHLDALFLAWIRQRDSFEQVDDEDLEDDFFADLEDEEFLFEDDLMSEDPFLPSLGGISGPTPLPQVAKSNDPVQDYQNLLANLTLPEIREVARRRGVALTGARKDPIVETLAQALAQPKKLAEDWSSLSPEARRVAGVLPFFANLYLSKQEMPVLAKAANLKNDRAVQDALEELQRFGVLFLSSYGAISFPATLPYWMPPDPDLVPLYQGAVDPDRIQEAANPRAFVQILVRLLLLLRSERLQVTARPKEKSDSPKIPFLAGWPVDPKDVERISRDRNPLQAVRENGIRVIPQDSLLLDDSLQKLVNAFQAVPERIDFQLRVMSDMNLIQISPGKPVRVNEETAGQFIQKDLLAAARNFFGQYISLNSWTEFDLAFLDPKTVKFILSDYTAGLYPRLLLDLSLFRQSFFFMLRRFPAGAWIDLDGMVEQAFHLPVAVAFQVLWRYGKIEINGRKMQPGREEDWKQLYRYYLQAIIEGPLYWQGLVDLSKAGNGLTTFRLTDFGAAVLLQAVDFQIPAPEHAGPALSFTGDGKLRLHLDSADGEIIALLSMLGEPELSGSDEIIYRPQLKGARRAFEAGWTLERVENTLREAAGQQPLPAPLANSLRRWWQNYGSLQIYSDIALIELGDDFALNELLAGTSLHRYLLYRFSPRLVAIRPEGVGPLREEMVKKGYTPRITS